MTFGDRGTKIMFCRGIRVVPKSYQADVLFDVP